MVVDCLRQGLVYVATMDLPSSSMDLVVRLLVVVLALVGSVVVLPAPSVVDMSPVNLQMTECS